MIGWELFFIGVGVILYLTIFILHRIFVYSKYVHAIQVTEQQITNANVAMGQFQENFPDAPFVDQYYENTHKRIDELVLRLQEQENHLLQHRTPISSLVMWIGAKIKRSDDTIQ